MNIRRATLDDLPKLAVLFDEYRIWYRQKPNLVEATQFLKERLVSEESIILIIEDDEDVSGFLQLYPIFSSVRLRRMYLLNDLYIHDSKRGLGLGKALINAAKAECKLIDGSGLLLETEKNNAVGNKLYVQEGFHLEENNFYFWPCQ